MSKKTEILNLSNYPTLLKEIHKPPERLYYKGDISLLNKPCISVVGTRKYSDYGEEMTAKIIRELSVLDICIVSGLALGIDSIAHRTALECGTPTIAVLGSGIDNIYPPQNLELAEEIQNSGLLLSEYSDMREPLKINFPQRNRIVSGLSLATILIEAPEKSGALITADLALNQGREVFVVPGDIDRENSIGPLHLLQKGHAYPISSGQEIIEILREQPHLFKLNSRIKERRSALFQPRPVPPKKVPPIPFDLSPSQSRVLKLFPKSKGLDMETLEHKSNLPIRELLQSITMLEMQQLIVTKSGKYYRNC
ncbi:MAG: DNA-processing protein DprA [Candidatus Peregrinibacteria bacterium]|nr:DNA-processing protein DprA [Candidatus Peregrinibacteria bacterium]